MSTVLAGVCTLDPTTAAGITNCLSAQVGIDVLPAGRSAEADVLVAAFDRFTTEAIAALRAASEEAGSPVVLVVSDIHEDQLPAAVACDVRTILPRAAAVDPRFGENVRATAVSGVNPPPGLLSRLAEDTHNLRREPGRIRATGKVLTERELEVLRLLADGLSTNEIARELSYSEGTVKNIVYAIIVSLGLRNRSHAVAYAMRAGLI